ncbi:hydrolase [Sphaerisporangium krabiense]|uniref:D-alanyl-D-alanine carboxypeptidase n=1 Tax=Sphaerisporangium krabiense TaxID=763782 RepID=A0A7W8Z7P6_9ACTN|nr:serine hydrolase domain-containing protein [Sphaerisporangium krabiense]MBB5628916.1 D-alanyl-D-alanine carboxypeptidase [Sphaerisporangium krabiense]GII60243.1 hydrolase [Sphaerisporangium krabiense]
MAFARFSLRKAVTAVLGAGTALLTWTAVTAPPATAQTLPPRTAPAGTALDRQALARTLGAVVDAGMYGTYSSVRDTRERWQGAAGVADVRTKRPVTPGMLQRVGSISKTFTAVAVLQQVARGRVDLDAPIGRYLPDLVPGPRGQAVTVRMLLNHTSGIGDYILGAFPSLAQGSPASLDENRFRTARPEELARIGLNAPATGEPGKVWSYSNTNYVIAGLLLEKVTGTDAATYITREVIRKAGLKDTVIPRTPFIPGPHSKMYESLYGLIDPPRDYSVYDGSWYSTAGAVVSTMSDLNTFYRTLLSGHLLGQRELAEMQRTVPVTDENGNVVIRYGLGIYAQNMPCGQFWGHDGAVFGAGTFSLSSPDGARQVSLGINLMKYQRIDENGNVEEHPIDLALGTHILQALCGPSTPTTLTRLPFTPFPTESLAAKTR